jgi:hypothetical protein
MDTQKWGPDGWKLLHSIAYDLSYNKDNKEDKDNISIKRFFQSVQYILPCIYCRRSFKQYLYEEPVDYDNLFNWLYTVHNKVNDKLKKQGYNDKQNPSFIKVKRDYSRYFNKRKNCTEMGWNFLYSTVFNYDEGISDTRKRGYLTFFYLLGKFLPNEKSRERYTDYMSKHPIEKRMTRREDLVKWMYGLERVFRSRCCTFEHRCKKIEKYRVNKCVNKTCRSG